jgi:hypothetical protein
MGSQVGKFESAPLTYWAIGLLASSDYRDVVETLKGRGILRSGIHVQ